MKFTVRILGTGESRPPAGASIIVEARDTTFEDARAPTIASAVGTVRESAGGDELLDTVELEVDALPDSSIVWVHVDVDGDGRLSVGDFATMSSYPIQADALTMAVQVRRV